MANPRGEIYDWNTSNFRALERGNSASYTQNVISPDGLDWARPHTYQWLLSQGRGGVLRDIAREGTDLKKTLNANGVFSPEDMKFNTHFYRFPRNDPFNYVDGAREYLFFTKPDLPFINDVNATTGRAFLTDLACQVPYFEDLADSAGYREAVFKNLCYTGACKSSDKCPFIRILSNRKTSNMDIPDIQIEEIETAANIYGTRIKYPKSSQGADEDVDFNIEFEDTRFLEIYHLFKVWDYYRALKWYGVISPAMYLGRKPEYSDYTLYKVLHDHIRVFKFLVDNDGETILYAASAIGCYPKTIQRSSFSEISDRGPLKITVGFKVSGWFDDIMTDIIDDFNVLVNEWQPISTSKRDGIIQEIYDLELGHVSQELVQVPWIERKSPSKIGTPQAGRTTDFYRYQLKWSRKV